MEKQTLESLGLDTKKYEYWFPWMSLLSEVPHGVEYIGPDGIWRKDEGRTSKSWVCLRRWPRIQYRQPTKADLLASAGELKAEYTEGHAWTPCRLVSAFGNYFHEEDGFDIHVSALRILDVPRWRAKRGEDFWLVDFNAYVASQVEKNIVGHDTLHEIGNYFRTREEAVKACKWLYGVCYNEEEESK